MLAIDDKGKLYSWGAAHNGELGTGKRLRELRPVLIETDERFHQVQAGLEFSLAISEQGKLYGWGSCANGVLGNGRKVGSVLKPTRIRTGDIIWRTIVAHRYHVLGIGQGKSSAPEGWSLENEMIDPDTLSNNEDNATTHEESEKNEKNNVIAQEENEKNEEYNAITQEENKMNS